MRDWGCRVVRIAVKQRFHILVKELLRKAIHICTAFVPLFLSFAYWPVIWILLIMVIVYTTAEFMRQRGATVPVISAITAAAARKRDENHFVLGPVTLACGVLLTALFFPPEAAAVGIFALAFGDGLASLAGKLFGRIRIPYTEGKTVAGSLTCFAAIYITTFAVTNRAFDSLVVASCGMFTELLPLKDFDNLFIPCLLAAIVLVLEKM